MGLRKSQESREVWGESGIAELRAVKVFGMKREMPK